jgi:hypothetical protein
VSDSVVELTLSKTIDGIERFSSNFTFEDVIENAYRIPENSSLPSIDSYMTTDSMLLMFQITVQERHPVKASGLIDLLNRLNKLELVKSNPEIAKIIFVVPSGIGSTYRMQKIAYGDANCINLERFDCSHVSGIGPATMKKLGDLNIRNCKELMSAFKRGDERLRFLNQVLENFSNMLALSLIHI